MKRLDRPFQLQFEWSYENDRIVCKIRLHARHESISRMVAVHRRMLLQWSLSPNGSLELFSYFDRKLRSELSRLRRAWRDATLGSDWRERKYLRWRQDGRAAP